MGLPHLCLVKNNDREKRPQRGARRLGCRLAFQTPCQFRAASCDRFAARLRLGQPDAFGAGALGRASAFLQRARLGLPPRPRRVDCPSLAFDGASIRPRRGRSPFKVCSSAVDVCFAFPTDFPRGRGRRGRRSSTLAAAFGGALRAVHIPKTERGTFPTKQACRKNAALGFPPPAGVAPFIGTLPRADGAESAALVRKSAAIESGTVSVD